MRISLRLCEKYTRARCAILSMADILYELGKNDKAEWFYRRLLEEEFLDERTRGISHYKIGMIRFHGGDYFVTVDSLEKCASFLKPSVK